MGHRGRNRNRKSNVGQFDTTDPLIGRTIGGRYQLARRIGSGGMSHVYLASDTMRDNQQIAIKFLRAALANLPGFVHRFQKEAEACRLLDHVNIVRVLDYGVAANVPYLALEYVDGHTLASALKAGALPVNRAINIVLQILAGLTHAHQRSVVHRDLKPGNVMLVPQTKGDDLVKVLDFGTAKIVDAEPESTPHAGTDIGTPWYMAPEQAIGAPTDHRCDLYTVGVILFELLTGERPYIADDPMRVLQMHMKSPIPSLRALKPELNLSPEIEGVIVRAMQKSPADRFVDARSFTVALHHLPETGTRKRSPSTRRATTMDNESSTPAESLVKDAPLNLPQGHSTDFADATALTPERPRAEPRRGPVTILTILLVALCLLSCVLALVLTGTLTL